MKNISVVSLFSGGGGLDLGFISEGYNIIWANDNDKNACDTYKKNIGDHIVCADINQLDIKSIPHADVVIGGPPCQSFSLAGKRHVEDARGQLVWRYMDIIRHVQPKAFVFENVTGLLSARNSEGVHIVDMLRKAFSEIGYNVQLKVLNAADYGAPQRRRRVIIVGLANGEAFEYPKPTHSENGSGDLHKYISVREALDDLPSVTTSERDVCIYNKEPSTDFQRFIRNGTTSTTEHFMPQMSPLDKYIVKHVKPGGNYMDIPKSVNSKRIQRLQKEGGHTTCYGRLDPNKPSYTINTYFNRPNVGCNIHYSDDRLITVREALRLQSFPDSYKIVSSSKQGRNLIVGNAVPPLLAKAVAHQLLKYIKGDKQ